jgi:hypothetical protein
MNIRNLASGDAVYFCKPEVWNRDKCGHPAITASRLDAGVWDLLMRVLKNPDVLIQQLERRAGKDDDGLRADVDAYERTLNDIKNRENALIRLAATLSDSEQLGEIQAQLAQLSRQRQSAQSAANQARRRLANQQRVLDQLVETVHRFQGLSHRVEEITWEEKRKVIQAFVVGVLVWPKESTPRWHADLRIPEFLSNGDEIDEALLDDAIEKPSVRR